MIKILEYSYRFFNPNTKRIVTIKAGDVELATLRAWKKNPRLRFMGVEYEIPRSA